ncbi:TIGR01458 family HAD-type hydrolase [Ktedonosporobacter rubrisoli]|uniref:Haloacid dehalogenase-like hydrolase domain-containing protein 2 n=1 Tax=Ktedonosporobacter rubrisoli TaxID=2509675 RepID=A0A4P6K3P7_KTERU|nr:TIGR01458 family HAD-type hydrolase [Ktedonosporobacter rubrisoli]QBD82675.1 TIGR01458 family HAD-type hydrolase [Ktedonosporobacter rubrisoli]
MASSISVRGILLDIDGVLHVGMKPIPGAAEAIQQFEQAGYRICFVTNTTTFSRSTLAQRLQQIDLPITEQQLITAPAATAQHIRQHFPDKRCWVLTKGDTDADFAGIKLVQDDAEVVVIGGAEELLTYEAMNQAFRMLMNGAELLAMHTNLFWRTSTGLQLDSGPFVRALEIASSKQATILGKPNRAFFAQALISIGVAAEAAIMVGDDIENDVTAAQRAGMHGILVCSGKYQKGMQLPAHAHPDAILPSIAELPAYLRHNS